MEQLIFTKYSNKLIVGSSEKANRTYFKSKNNVIQKYFSCFNLSVVFKKYIFVI